MPSEPKHPIPLGVTTVRITVQPPTTAVLSIFDSNGVLLRVFECDANSAPIALPADAYWYTLSAGTLNYS